MLHLFSLHNQVNPNITSPLYVLTKKPCLFSHNNCTAVKYIENSHRPSYLSNGNDNGVEPCRAHNRPEVDM